MGSVSERSAAHYSVCEVADVPCTNRPCVAGSQFCRARHVALSAVNLHLRQLQEVVVGICRGRKSELGSVEFHIAAVGVYGHVHTCVGTFRCGYPLGCPLCAGQKGRAERTFILS